jgi:hypothetical protein
VHESALITHESTFAGEAPLTGFTFTRRELLGSAALGLLSFTAGRVLPGFAATSTAGTTYVLAPEYAKKMARSGEASVGVINLGTGEYHSIPVPCLGHSIVGHPTDRTRVIMLGQRPLPHSVEIDLNEMAVTRVIQAGEGRYFYGHGIFDPAGEHVYATENHEQSEQGFISIRDGKTFQLIGGFASHGVGPHELAFHDNGKLTVIANGGLESKTVDELEHEVPNMKPTLDIVETASGKLLQTYRLPDPKLSIRHLALGPNGEIAVSLKSYSSTPLPYPAVALGTLQSGIVIPEVPPALLPQLRASAFGVELSENGKLAAVTHPDAKLLSIWDVENHAFVNAIPLGVPPEGVTRLPGSEGFLLNSLYGALAEIDRDGNRVTRDHIAKVTGLNWKHASSWTV